MEHDMIASFVLSGAPRTKKTSLRVITIPGKKDAEGNSGKGFTKVLPSKQYQKWFEDAVKQGPSIRFALQKAGVVLPFRTPVSLKALVFRDRLTGDLVGHLQAICDAIQVPIYKFDCRVCKKGTLSPDHRGVKCAECGAQLNIGKQSRDGVGIIMDDSLVQSTDGSRLLKDATRPRVEITIEDFLEVPVQADGLFDAIEREPEIEQPHPRVTSAPHPRVVPRLVKPQVPTVAMLPKAARKRFEMPSGLLLPGDPDY